MILEWKVPPLGLSVCALPTQRSQKQTGWGLVTKLGARRIRVQIPTLWVSAKWRLWFLQLACGCGWTRCGLQEHSVAIMVTVSIFWMEKWSKQRSCFLISHVKQLHGKETFFFGLASKYVIAHDSLSLNWNFLGNSARRILSPLKSY